MRLQSEWKKIVKKAWSMRFAFAASLFATAEALLPLFSDKFPRGVFAVLTLLAIFGSMVSRVLAQKEFNDE